MDLRDTVKIQLEDKDCRGVSSPDNSRRYDVKDGVVELPRYEADRILQTSGPASRYRKTWGVGVDLKALDAKRRARDGVLQASDH